jgi:helix-turn-helix protein
MSTTTSADKQFVDELRPGSVTVSRLCPVIEINHWKVSRTELPEGFAPLDTVVGKYEADPKRKAALDKARKWLAKSFASTESESLRVLRLRKGLSQADVASRAKTTQAQIARIESGQQDVQVGSLVRIAGALGIEPLEAIKSFLVYRKADK